MVLTLMRQDSRAGILILQLPAGVMAEFERLKKVNAGIVGAMKILGFIEDTTLGL